MLAEALNEQGYAAGGEAFAALNEVRRRAGLPEETAATVANQVQFRAAGQQEHRAELAFENHHRHDLVRPG